jgi:hypothetical protein
VANQDLFNKAYTLKNAIYAIAPAPKRILMEYNDLKSRGKSGLIKQSHIYQKRI